MYTDISTARVLFSLGFPHKSIAPGDAYGIKNQEWIAGGEVYPTQSASMPPVIIKQGTWLPSTLDLFIWLSSYADRFEVKHDMKESKCVQIDAQKLNKKFIANDYCSTWFPLSKIIIELLLRLKKEHARAFSHTPPRAIYQVPVELIAHERRYLSEKEMIELSSHGFSIDHAHLESETDCHAYQGKVFVLGGPLFFRKTPALLCPTEIRTHGMRLASFDNLKSWLFDRVSLSILKEKNKPYQATLYLEQGQFLVEADSLLHLFQNLIIKTLEIAPELAACDQPEPVILQK